MQHALSTQYSVPLGEYIECPCTEYDDIPQICPTDIVVYHSGISPSTSFVSPQSGLSSTLQFPSTGSNRGSLSPPVFSGTHRSGQVENPHRPRADSESAV